ncbi:MAG TPA: sigma-70 family RNA polymerase sigma factor [Thermoanaerobaculia bacterium]|jgi:RNA polymerase sigma-70 factor (ECF subfamily)
MTTNAALRQPIETLGELATRLEPRLKQIVNRYRIPAQDAEDLLQTALIATLRNWSELADPEGWLVRTVINQCLMYHRSRRRHPSEPLDDAIELLPVPSPEERMADREEIERRLARLPHQCRQLFRLRFIYGFNAKEVAELLGRKISSVYNTTHRCTKLLESVRTLPPPAARDRRRPR